MDGSSYSPENSHYGGLIFIVSAPSSVDKKSNRTPFVEQPTIPSRPVLIVPNSEESHSVENSPEDQKHRKRSLKRMNSVDSSECCSNENVITPRPLSEEHFFDSSSTQTIDNADCDLIRSNGACICCDIFCHNQKSTNHSECACGHCCNCMHSFSKVPRSLHCTLYGNSEQYNKEHEKSFGPIGPQRRRSWEARMAVVNSLISQIPKQTPHLVLVAEPQPSVENVNSPDTSDDLPPILYPMADNLKYPFTSESSNLNSESCSFDSTSPSPSVNITDSAPADWMPAGTNILGMLLMLNESWRSVY